MSTTVRVRFQRWIDWTGLTEAEVARRLGCDVSYPGKIAKRGRRPGLEVASAIERESALPRADGEKWKPGPILMREWLDETAAAEPKARRTKAA